MEPLIMSVVILLGLAFVGIYGSYRLWWSGYLGKLIILGVFSLIALEVQAKIYPQQLIKQNYARVILGVIE